MKRAALPLAVVLLIGAVAFAVYRYQSSFGLPRGTGSRAPTPPGHGPTAADMERSVELGKVTTAKLHAKFDRPPAKAASE